MAIAPVVAPPTQNGLTLSRKALLAALERAQPILPTRYCKPIFGGVRLQAAAGLLHLAVSDGETTLAAQLEAAGDLPPCVVPCTELVRRLRASKEPTAMLAVRARPSRLILNGGRVEHTLHPLALGDFPRVPDGWQGAQLTVAADELRTALSVASWGMAGTPSRYALNGVLLESDEQGCRVVATDGRRLVVVGLTHVGGPYRGQFILPARLVKLVEKLAAAEDGHLVLAIKPNATEQGAKLPSDLYVAGPAWLLALPEPEGHFPLYREVVPVSASRFAVERQLLVETLQQVLLATGDYSRAVALGLRPRSVELSASSAESGSAHAKLPARFLGGGDSVIHTGFNPDYLLEAVKTLPGDRVVLDVAQNGCGSDGKLFGKPALVYAADDPRVRWVLMPLNMGYPATREYLGSNFKTEPAHAG